MTVFEPRNPDYAERVRQAFADQGFMETLGVCFESVAPGEVVLSLPFASTLTQHHGLFHGGVIGALADNTAGFASYSLVSVGQSILTVRVQAQPARAGGGKPALGHREGPVAGTHHRPRPLRCRSRARRQTPPLRDSSGDSDGG